VLANRNVPMGWHPCWVRLHATILSASEIVRGRIVFDAPGEAVELVYAPGLRSLATWTLV
jgi:hypothetical protein